MSIHYRQQGAAIVIFGNTFPFKDEIKAIGGRFNGAEKTWQVTYSEASLLSVAALCERVGGGQLTTLGAVTRPLELRVSPLEPAATSPVAKEQAHADKQSLTVRQLMERLSLTVAAAFPKAVWVTGEVQNLTRRASGAFFDLAEGRQETHGSATITARAIAWQGALDGMAARHGAERMQEVLQDGMTVRCLCQVQLYKDRGSVTLVVEDLDPAYTKGALALAREKLLKELRAKGLDQAQKRLRIPAFPLRLGLISADNSRAKSDFLDQLAEAGFPGQVLFVATPMQGEGVVVQVVRALKRLVRANCDLIVVTRGGGSAADLRWFDAPEVAYAIAQCPVAVVAAIGHHDDVSVAEVICHQQQKTPTAAADFVAQRFVQTRRDIDQFAGGLARTLGRRVEELALFTTAVGERLAAAANTNLASRDRLLAHRRSQIELASANSFSRARATLAAQAGRLAMAAHAAQTTRATALALFEAQLRARDPSPWLALGWTQLVGAHGRIKSALATKAGDKLRAQLKDGWLDLTVAAAHIQDQETGREP